MTEVIGNGPTGGLDLGQLAGIRWTDKSFPLGRDKQGQTQKPDFDFTELGLLFPQNDASEKIYILDQMLHQKKLGTSINLHVHFLQDTVNIPNFVCEYRFYNSGDPIPGWTTINTDAGSGVAFTFVATPLANIIPFPEISAPIGEKVSAVLDMILYRNDNRVVGDVLTKYVDYHFQIDSSGSKEPFTK